ncbi:nicotinate-nucleotide adenylyltransferase [Mariniblastus fucicola]|uniref:Probable nicotinate-nucleotide adenylyltransferase n=1 Tax=Mariniblastus fucicola TaxID=980251 RepID=A0A5B9P2X1_9BACT|nr:nicotinate-nucleotide adenylyltransferase [Mariniblastus fucicola]QEG20504.1 Nicotinate-nucleotide adenylyltransferase [Mariniblastus fucicola]
MRIGVFGGSFDPIHLGHLILAENCREQSKLDQVLFMPCALSPHKLAGAHGTDRQRLEMLDLAIGGHRDFVRSDLEIKRGGISYTVDTLRELESQQPGNEWFFLMGADSLKSFATWREPEEILKLARPIVVGRPGSGPVDPGLLEPLSSSAYVETLRELSVESPLIDISSTKIRQRVADEQSIRFLVPRSIEQYIVTQKMYQVA